MDSFTDPYVEVVAFIKPTQVGATEAGINLCAYTIGSDPARILYIMPDDDLAKDFSCDRLQPALKACPEIAKKFEEAERSKAKVVRFPGGFLRFEGAQSPAKLSSWAIPRVVMDEVDKYPRWSGKESSPVELIKERTKNWPWRKVFIMSTPTTEAGNIYQAYINSEARYKFYVPCPHCGEYQVLDFEHLKFTRNKRNGVYDLKKAAESAYYECINCNGKIHDADKKEMLKKGKWKLENEAYEHPKSVGFSLNSLYSPWVTFGQMAVKFLEVKDDPSLLMNFVNSWLGEPWKSKASRIEVGNVMRQKTKLRSGVVPKWARLLTAGVDCQKGYFFWTVRAWGVGMTSQKVANGTAITFSDLSMVMDKFWPVEDSEDKVQIALYCVDSGYEAENVYDYCYNNLNIAVPVKGSSRPMTAKFSRTHIQPRAGRSATMTLYVADTDQYKNFIVAHMNKEEGTPGAWLLDADTTQEYAEMICSEHKVLVEQGRYPIEKWEKISSARPNHYLDCEVYAAVAADIMNVRYLTDEVPEQYDNQGEYSPGTYKP